MFTRLRKTILSTDPEVEELWKWGTAVWNCNGNICAICTFKDYLKINFFKGAYLNDPKKVFNNGLESKNARSIDIFEKDKVDFKYIEKLVKEAVKINMER